MNNNQGKNKGIAIQNLSFNIIVGWLGHELAHICEYEKMSTWQTLTFAVKYVFSEKYKKQVERYTDLLTIEHGLAFPLYDGVNYLLNDKSISTDYKQSTINNYGYTKIFVVRD